MLCTCMTQANAWLRQVEQSESARRDRRCKHLCSAVDDVQIHSALVVLVVILFSLAVAAAGCWGRGRRGARLLTRLPAASHTCVCVCVCVCACACVCVCVRVCVCGGHTGQVCLR